MSKKPESNKLLVSIKQLIEQSRQQLALSVNANMSMLYWKIGKRINSEILLNKRAEYKTKIVATLWRQFEIVYGNLFLKRIFKG